MNMNIDLTPIIQAIIGLMAALITWKVIPWIQARTTKEQRGNMQAIIETLVYAAEQLYGANKGQEKLDYVFAELEKKGFKADRNEIEAAVYQAFNSLPALNAVTIQAETSTDRDEDKPEVYLDAKGEVQLNIDKWSLEQLKSFCALNEIPTDGCLTREDYMDAIADGANQGATMHEKEPPDEGGEE